MRIKMASSPTACRQCLSALTRRAYSSVNTSALKSRPAKFIPDYLAPMPSHLLTTTLSDLLPRSSHPPPSSPAIATPPRTLPPGHHLVYFPIQTAPSHLAADGADPDHSPGGPFARRLWAGGEVRFHGAQRLALDGAAWACTEEIEDVTVRGAEGDEKVFVDVWRRYGLGHHEGKREAWDIEERRTLVFMRNQETEVSPPPQRLIKYPHKPSFSVSLTPTPTHLFHFSALTFNAHAIHLDPLYARSVDGHRGLLVHGPLTLALMLRVLTDHVASVGGEGVAVRSIAYRNHAPLYANEKMTVCVRRTDGGQKEGEQKWDVWVEGPEGGLAVKGSVVAGVNV